MTLGYDFSGNRNQVTTNGVTKNWTVNHVNEYTAADAGAVQSDVKGNVQSYNGWSYSYDAQNRLRLAQGDGKTLEFGMMERTGRLPEGLMGTIPRLRGVCGMGGTCSKNVT